MTKCTDSSTPRRVREMCVREMCVQFPGAGEWEKQPQTEPSYVAGTPGSGRPRVVRWCFVLACPLF